MEEGTELQKEFVCVATFLPLKSWFYLAQFQIMSARVLKQARKVEGVVRYAVRADFPKRYFWTLSIWKDNNSMRHFVTSEPHATAMKKFSVWAGEGAAFVEWTSKIVKLTGRKHWND